MYQETLLLLKQRSALVLICISMLFTLLSLLNGWQNIQHIHHEIDHAQQEAETRLEQQLEEMLSHYTASDEIAGSIGYYIFQNTYRIPNEWSFIALGNRIVTPYIQRIRLLGLQGQLYDGESHHPEYVMLGSFDYAFWLIFFSPLLCIALMHDLKATEHQAKRLTLLQSLSNNSKGLWIKRALVRWGLIVMSLVLPLTLFTVWHQLSLKPWLAIVTLTITYTLFWIVLCGLIGLRKSAIHSNMNAIAMVTCWLFICFIMPSLGKWMLDKTYPLVDGSKIALQHREHVHHAWDIPKEDTLQPFYQHYPQYKDTPPVTGRFHWKWYFAFQHMADVKLAPLVEQRESTLNQRHAFNQTLAWVLPSLFVQQTLEKIAQSDISDLIHYRHEIESYHTALRHYLYPYLFTDKAFKQSDFEKMPSFTDKKTQ